MKYIITILTLLFAFNASSGDIIDSLGYRLYHDMDNERDGAKLRLYVGKQTLHFGKFKMHTKEKEVVLV